MRILFVNLPYVGHIIPTVGLVQALIKAGHQVTYLLPHGWESYLQGSGADFLGYENSPKLDQQIRSAFLKAESVIGGHDLVIYEQFFFVGKHLAEKNGKKCVRIFTAPATNHDLMKKFLSSGGPMGIFRLPLIGRLWTADAIKGLGIHLECPNWLDEIVESPPDCNLVYTLRQFQPDEEQFSEYRFHFIGPSIYDRPEDPFPTLQAPVIYISLGTILKGASTFFQTCIEAFRNEKVTVVLSVGKDFDISKLGPIPENFVIRNHVPQTAVLRQSNLFITHGGMNSVSEAMVAEVPMLVIPFVSDQPVNARQVQRLGLGEVLSYQHITPQVLKDAAFSVLWSEKIRRNICALSRIIRKAPGNTGAVEIIENFVQQ